MKNLFFVLVVLLIPLVGFAQEPARSLPFTKEQNLDGSKFVWFMYSQSGFSYEYVSTKDFPISKQFGKVSSPQVGDVAWWQEYMAIIKIEKGKPISIIAAGNENSFEELTKLYGEPEFYRLKVSK